MVDSGRTWGVLHGCRLLKSSHIQPVQGEEDTRTLSATWREKEIANFVGVDSGRPMTVDVSLAEEVNRFVTSLCGQRHYRRSFPNSQ